MAKTNKSPKGVVFRTSFIHYRTGKRVYSKNGRPFPIGRKK